MKPTMKKGFTLIELLVVIAIIGVLSSVVLTSLNSARNKANNAKIKGQLATARSQAEIYYDSQSPNSYGVYSMVTPATTCGGGMFNAVAPGLVAITGTASAWPSNMTLSCQSTGQAYAISVSMPVGEGTGGTLDVWCVDSNGRSIGITDHLGQNDVICN